MQKELFSNRTLLKLILPLAAEQLLLVTVGMADTVMVSIVGEAAVSGISLVDSINILLIQLFAALATGGAVVASQYLGRRDAANARGAAKQLLFITTSVAAIVGIASIVFNRHILSFVFGHVEPAVMQAAETYFWLSAASYPFLAIYNAGAALFRSMGNSKVSLYASLLMNIVNISGNAILIFGFGMGVAGAAIASLVSRALAAVMVLMLLRNKSNPIYFEDLLHYRPHKGLITSILKVGVPSGVESSMFQVGKLLLAGLIASFGTIAITANAITNNIASMSNIPGNAVGLALITVVGQCVGAKDNIAARYYTKKLMKISYISMLFINIVLFIGTDFLVSFYNSSAATTELARNILYISYIFNIISWPASFSLPNALRAAGDAKYTMMASMLSMWLCRIAMSYVLAYFGLGLTGIWIAMFLDWVVRAICFSCRFHGKKWLKSSVI